MIASQSALVFSRSCESILMTFVKQLCAWCVLSVSTAACGPVVSAEADVPVFDNDTREPADIAAEIFELEHGQLNSECLDYAYDAEFIPMDRGALGVQCGTKMGAAEACFFQLDKHGAKFAIALEVQDSKHVRVHELMHMMLQCQAGDYRAADVMHEDAVWSHIDPDQMGTRAERRN